MIKTFKRTAILVSGAVALAFLALQTSASELEEVRQAVATTNSILAETYYILTVPLMMIIHAGFLAYEMGATRVKNVLASGIKNILAFALPLLRFTCLAGGSIGHSPQGLP